VGFLGDQPPCRRLVGFLWGLQKPLTSLADQTRGIQVRQLLRARDHSSSNPAWPGQPTRERWFRAPDNSVPPPPLTGMQCLSGTERPAMSVRDHRKLSPELRF
jgi:hypothetical protein